MKAGRKLDAAIVEALGGEVVWRMRPEWKGYEVRHGLWVRNYRESGRVTYSIAAQYSTSGGDALRLARDEMRPRGLYLFVVDLRQEGGGDGYRVSFQSRVVTVGEAVARDLPHAIALAALAALENQSGGVSL